MFTLYNVISQIVGLAMLSLSYSEFFDKLIMSDCELKANVVPFFTPQFPLGGFSSPNKLKYISFAQIYIIN